MEWIHLAYDRDKWRALVKMVIKMQGISLLAVERSASQGLCSTEFGHALCMLHDATKDGMERAGTVDRTGRCTWSGKQDLLSG